MNDKSDYLFSVFAFDRWYKKGSGDNSKDLERAKKMIPIIIEDYLTITQKKYLIHYYVDDLNMAEIAEIYGVDSSSVSHTMKRALKVLYDHLRFVSPHFIDPTCLPARKYRNYHRRKIQNNSIS